MISVYADTLPTVRMAMLYGTGQRNLRPIMAASGARIS